MLLRMYACFELLDRSYRHYRRLLLSVCLSLCCTLTNAAPQALTMIISSDSAPKMFVNAEGNPDGYLPEIAMEAGRRAGFDIHIVAVPWARAVNMAEHGEGIICGLSLLPEREKIYRYSVPVVVDRVLIVTMKNKHMVANSLADLKGKVVGVSRGSKYGEKFANELSLVTVDEDSSSKLRLKKLAMGRIDGAIMPGGVAAVRMNARLAEIPFDDLTVQKTAVALDPNYFAIAHSVPDANGIIGRLDAALNSMIADGSLNKILAAWNEQK